MRIGGLDFEVLPRPAGFLKDAAWHVAYGKVALVREDTGEVYGYASEDYVPIQYREAFDFVDEINPEYVAAGALKGGRQGFLVARLPSKYRIMLNLHGTEDPHALYVLLRTSHDLTRGIEIILTTLRDKCMNMLTLPSITAGAKQAWSIRHTTNVRVRMAQAKNIITSADSYALEFERIASRLADIDLTIPAQETILRSVLPDKPTQDEQVSDILAALDFETNNEFKGTGWGLLNATNEYFLYLRSGRARTIESRFTDGIDGTAHRMSSAVMMQTMARHR
jgi:phage/plasmid-like protein (TIGR03299 family)